MAAAFFNNTVPPGPDWQATSAGQEPDEVVGPTTVQLLAGTDAESHLDLETPRPIAAVIAPDRVVAIDCDVPGAERWNLANQEFDEAMRDEIRNRAETLAKELMGDAR